MLDIKWIRDNPEALKHALMRRGQSADIAEATVSEAIRLDDARRANIKSLQEALIALGYSCGKWGADGEFGKATKSAVVAFQTANSLTADGIVGSKTVAAINALLRHFDARQRPADFIDIQRIDDPPARTQQRAGVKIEHRRGKRPAQLRGQSGIKNQIAELGLAGQL